MKIQQIYIILFLVAVLNSNKSKAQVIVKNQTIQKVKIKEGPLTTTLTKEKIVAFIKTRMSPNKPIRNTKINKVIQNIQYENMYIERLSGGVKLLIIPMNKVYFSQNIDKTKTMPLQYVLIYEREKELISRADFMMVYPNDKSITKMPLNAFFDYQYQKPTQIDGTYKLVSFGDIIQCELYVENGNRKQFKSWNHKSNLDNNGIDDCNDWNLETTIFNIDGTIKDTKQNLGKTCTECPPGYICDSIKK